MSTGPLGVRNHPKVSHPSDHRSNGIDHGTMMIPVWELQEMRGEEGQRRGSANLSWRTVTAAAIKYHVKRVKKVDNVDDLIVQQFHTFRF